jgi:hypothetical protein
MSLAELCTSYISSAKLKDDSERNIIEFAEAPWGLGMGTIPGMPPLFPVQKFIFKCYYNILLDDKDHDILIKDRFNEKDRYRFTEIEYLNYLWNEGRINVKEITGNMKESRPNLLLVIGRRGLKTSSIAILTAFETYKLVRKISPQEYYGIPPDDEIRVSCIATNQEQASELFRRISGHLERSDYFKNFRNKPTLNFMQLSTQRDIETFGPAQSIQGRPSIRIVASPCSGRGIRGHNNIIAVLDEMAYFFESDSSDDKSDRAIYDAVTPSVAKFSSPEGEPHGRIISISSPAARTGKFFELYQRSMEADCNDLLMIQAPTWEVDYTLSPKFLRAKYAENSISFNCEYGAQFSDRVTAWIENEQYLRVNIIPGLREKTMSYERIPHFMGIDIGMKNDGTAIAICHIVRKEVGGILKDLIELDCCDVRYAKDEEKEHFYVEEMADWIATYAEKFFIVRGVMDQEYCMALIPALHDRNNLKQLEAIRFTRELNSRVYQNLMTKMLDNALRIPEGEPRIVEGRKVIDLELVTELLRLQATIHSKYMISVEAPDIKGLHDDMSDAFARAVYLATEYLSNTGTLKNNITESTSGSGSGSGMSYKKYLTRQKRGLLYTNRPSTGLQTEFARRKSIGSFNSINSLGSRMWR